MEIDQIKQLCEAFGGSWFFYGEKFGQQPLMVTNRTADSKFQTASVIKVPILLAWLEAERRGLVSSDELCNLDDETKVEGSGFSYLMRARQLPYADVLMMMIATSDNTCTNAVISRLGFDFINTTFRDIFDLQATHLGRKMMTRPQPEKGIDNWTTGADMIHCYQLIQQLTDVERNFVAERLKMCQASDLFLRDIRGDGVIFYHKTGGLRNVMNDWGYSDDCRLFMLTNDFSDYQKVYKAFGILGKTFLVSKKDDIE
jgi:beta-lactamase class A